MNLGAGFLNQLFYENRDENTCLRFFSDFFGWWPPYNVKKNENLKFAVLGHPEKSEKNHGHEFSSSFHKIHWLKRVKKKFRPAPIFTKKLLFY